MLRYKTITELSHDILPYWLAQEPDLIKTNASHFLDVCFETDSCEYDIDLGLVGGYTKGRWTRLVTQYVEPTHLEAFVNSCKALNNQVSVSFLFKPVAQKKLDHQYGNCLLAVTYVGNKLTLFSRTCFAGYMSYLDLALAHKIACLIGSPSEISFKWCILDWQISYLRTLQTIMLNKKLFAKLEYLSKHPKKLAKESITWQRILGVYNRRFLYHYDRVGMNILSEAKYGPVKKIIKRWLSMKGRLEMDYPKSLLIQDVEIFK